MQISFNKIIGEITLASFPGLACDRHLQYEIRAKACSVLLPDACHSIRHDHSTGTNDVIDELGLCLALKESPRDHSEGTGIKLPKCQNCWQRKTQAAIFSMIVYIQTPWPHHVIPGVQLLVFFISSLLL